MPFEIIPKARGRAYDLWIRTCGIQITISAGAMEELAWPDPDKLYVAALIDREAWLGRIEPCLKRDEGSRPIRDKLRSFTCKELSDRLPAKKRVEVAVVENGLEILLEEPIQ